MKNTKKVVIVLIVVILIVSMIFVFAGCFSMPFTQSDDYDMALIKIGNEYVDVKIKSWSRPTDGQISLKLEDGTFMIVSMVTTILYNGKLPMPLLAK